MSGVQPAERRVRSLASRAAALLLFGLVAAVVVIREHRGTRSAADSSRGSVGPRADESGSSSAVALSSQHPGMEKARAPSRIGKQSLTMTVVISGANDEVAHAKLVLWTSDRALPVRRSDSQEKLVFFVPSDVPSRAQEIFYAIINEGAQDRTLLRVGSFRFSPPILTYQVALRPLDSLTLHLSTSSGRVLGGAVVELRPNALEHVTLPAIRATADRSGHVLVSGAAPCVTWDLCLQFGSKLPDRAFGHVVRGWVPRDARIVVPEDCGLSGAVVDERGEKLRGVDVAIRSALGCFSTTTGDNGEFQFLHVPSSRVELCAGYMNIEHARSLGISGGGATDWRGLDVPVAGLADVKLVVNRERILEFVVRGAREDVRDTQIIVSSTWGEENRRWGGFRYPDVDGHVVLAGLAANERYSAWARSGSKCAVVRGVLPGRHVHLLALREGAKLRGSVHPMPKRCFTNLRSGLLAMNFRVHDDGKFTVEGLPPGDWTLRVWDLAAEADAVMVATFVVGPDDEEVECHVR